LGHQVGEGVLRRVPSIISGRHGRRAIRFLCPGDVGALRTLALATLALGDIWTRRPRTHGKGPRC
jgi:hypothetical protein